MPSPLDRVLDAARAALEARRQELLDRAAKIRSATDAYVEAVELALASEVAGKFGVEGPSAASSNDAAAALLDLVRDLPELRQAALVTAPTASTPEPPRVVVTVLEREPPSTPKRPSFDSYEAGPEAKALWAELRSLDLEDMPVALFKATAAELAARARILQQRDENAELIPERVIKKLTAYAAEKGVKGIYGLARHHDADWEDLARKAKAESDRLRNCASGLTQKLPIPAKSVGQLLTKSTRAAEPEGKAVEVEDLPNLQAAAKVKPIVLVGGLVVNEKLDWIEGTFGFRPEWIETKNTVKAAQSLEGRILDGNVAAVVVLEGLLGHKHYEPIIAATRQTGTPLAYGDTAGTGSLKKAFEEIEDNLG